jgi:hypothetical protein
LIEGIRRVGLEKEGQKYVITEKQDIHASHKKRSKGQKRHRSNFIDLAEAKSRKKLVLYLYAVECASLRTLLATRSDRKRSKL